MHWLPAYVGLGSNLSDPPARLRAAFTALAGLPATRLVLQSGLWGSKPFGPVAQPDFCNAVAALLTQLGPEELFGELRALESLLGREPPRERWGPRVIDLDLLAVGAQRVATPDLTLPHPGLAERAFVLFPWRELAPGFEVPGLGSIASLAARLPADAAWRLP
jgi:2-amino-4-hydroxy-6-hydroxymethyldihydropteridine diphosphokinase